MHWFFEYPWGPALTWVVVAAVLGVLGVSFYTIRREIRSLWAITVIGLRVLTLAIVVFLLLEPQMASVKATTLRPQFGVLVDASKSMSIKDPGSADSRLQIINRLLGDEEDGLLAGLQEKGRVRLFQFDLNLSEVSMESLPELEPLGDATALGSAVSHAAEMLAAEDLAGLVVLTDGQNNAGRNPERVVISGDMPPLFIVGIGGTTPERIEEEKDYAVENLISDNRVMVERTADVQVTVTSRGYANRVIPVWLYQDEMRVAETVVSLGPENPTAEAVLKYTPQVPGRYFYTVKMPVEDDELDKENNERTFAVNVIDPVNRVLYMEAAPRAEYTFLNRLLQRNRNLDMLTFVGITEDQILVQGTIESLTSSQALGEDQIEEFKVIIIGDVGRDYFSDGELQRMAGFVERGGSIIMLGGKENFGMNGFANTPLSRVLPITPATTDEYVEQETNVATTPEGAAHPIFQDIRINWSLAPTLKTFIRAGRSKPGATVLLSTPDGRHPAVVVQRYGQGKSALILTDSTWRWRLGQAAEPLPIDLYHVFWTSLVEWMLPEETETRRIRAVELITDRDIYELNEQVNMTVSVIDDDGIVTDALVQWEIHTPDKKVLRREVKPKDSAGGGIEKYQTFFMPHRSGKYTVTAVATDAGGREYGREEISLLVRAPAAELTITDLNEELLLYMARRSGGRYYTPEEARYLPDDITAKEQVHKRVEKRELWNEWWVLIAFVTLMTSEWIVRKRRQLA